MRVNKHSSKICFICSLLLLIPYSLLFLLLMKRKEDTMKAGILFTGSGPILILTSYDSFTNPNLVQKLSSKGIKKFIAFEVSEEMARKKYGSHYDVTLDDIKQEDDLRVLDYDGHHIYSEFSLKELGEPIFYEG